MGRVRCVKVGRVGCPHCNSPHLGRVGRASWHWGEMTGYHIHRLDIFTCECMLYVCIWINKTTDSSVTLKVECCPHILVYCCLMVVSVSRGFWVNTEAVKLSFVICRCSLKCHTQCYATLVASFWILHKRRRHGSDRYSLLQFSEWLKVIGDHSDLDWPWKSFLLFSTWISDPPTYWQWFSFRCGK